MVNQYTAQEEWHAWWAFNPPGRLGLHPVELKVATGEMQPRAAPLSFWWPDWSLFDWLTGY